VNLHEQIPNRGNVYRFGVAGFLQRFGPSKKTVVAEARVCSPTFAGILRAQIFGFSVV